MYKWRKKIYWNMECFSLHLNLKLVCLSYLYSLLWNKWSGQRLELVLVHVLAAHVSWLLLLVKHAVRFDVVQVAHVTYFSKAKVVVVTSLASPVTHSLDSGCCGRLSLLVEISGAVLISTAWVFFLHIVIWTDFLLFRVECLSCCLEHVFWLSLVVLSALDFLASEASLSSLEVVVLAFVAFPSTIWEFKFFLVSFDWLFNFSNLLLFSWELLVVKRSHAPILLGDHGELFDLVVGWSVAGGERWEIHIGLVVVHLSSIVVDGNIVHSLSALTILIILILKRSISVFLIILISIHRLVAWWIEGLLSLLVGAQVNILKAFINLWSLEIILNVLTKNRLVLSLEFCEVGGGSSSRLLVGF